MANIFHIDRPSNKITLGTTGTTINIASHTASRLLALDASKNLEVVTIGSSLDYTRPTLNTIQDIRTSASPYFTGIELGHASDTTLTRVSAGVVAIEGTDIAMVGHIHYVNRGDSATTDFVLGDFTIDSAWHDLDLSSIIPANTKVVVIRVYIKGSNVGESMRVNPYGYSNHIAPLSIKLSVANQSIANQFNVYCNGTPKIQYRISSNGWTTIELDVLGWWL